MYKHLSKGLFYLSVACFISGGTLGLPHVTSVERGIQFTSEEVLGGIMEKQSITCVNERGQREVIGSLGIILGKQLSLLDSPVFAEMDMSLLPPEVIDLLNLMQGIKRELTNSFEEVVLIGDLYINPKFRGHGYAKLLTQNVCKEIFSRRGVQFIALVPTPFEYENNVQKALHGERDYEIKKERLIRLYRSVGFRLSQDDTFMYLERN